MNKPVIIDELNKTRHAHDRLIEAGGHYARGNAMDPRGISWE